MPRLDNRIVPDDRDKHYDTLSKSMKILQESGKFTDVVLYCDGGSVSIHKTILTDMSPNLNALMEESACCFCLGTKCLKGSESYGITLVGASVSDVKSLVQLIYTGKTIFADTEVYQNIRDIADQLQIRLPSSSLSIEKGSGSPVPVDTFVSRKRKASDDSGGAHKLKVVFKRANDSNGTCTGTDYRLAEPSISSREESPEVQVSKNCPKCKKVFNDNGSYLRHVRSCGLPNSVQCPKCHQSFQDSPWFRNHVKTCSKAIEIQDVDIGDDEIVLDDEDLEDSDDYCSYCETFITKDHVCPAKINNGGSSSSSLIYEQGEGKRLCVKCNRYFFVVKGGYVRHVRACQGLQSSSTPMLLPTVPPVNGILSEDGKSKACPKCGKVYTPKNYRYFEPHVNRCQGSLDGVTHDLNSSNLVQIQTCAGCNKSFTLNHWYQKHVLSCRKRSDVMDPPLVPHYGCHLCSSNFTTKFDLKKHLIVHYGEKVKTTYLLEKAEKCPLCPFIGGGSLEQLLHHVCIQHEKLQEVLPADIARNLFNNNSEDSTPSSPSLPGDNNCHVCGKIFNSRTSLRSHIFTHYLGDLRKNYHDPKDPSACRLCPYRSSSIHHLMIHVGLKHKKLAEFLPREIATYFFDESNNVRPFPRPRAPAPPPPPPLKLMQPKPFSNSRYGPQKNWTCMFCYKEMGNDKGNLKQHLLCHTRDKIRDNFMNPDNPRSCLFCDYNSNLPDHMVTHVGLTHQKIREFLPRDYGDILFRGPYTFELQENNVAFCEHCTAEFTSVENLENHLKANGGNCSWTCSKCGVKAQGRKNIDKHQNICQRKPVCFSCDLCGDEVVSVIAFKTHLCSHFMSELVEIIGKGVTSCEECGLDFGSNSGALAAHIGTQHDLIFSVLPQNMMKKVKALMMESVYCFVCRRQFNSSAELSEHECNIADDDCEIEDDDGVEEYCRVCQSVQVTSYSQYKEHLYGHFIDKITSEFKRDYDKDKKSCERCENPVLSAENYVKHLALEHDELFKFIDQETLNHLKSILQKNSSSNLNPIEGFDMDYIIKNENMSPLHMSCDVDEDVISDYANADGDEQNSISIQNKIAVEEVDDEDDELEDGELDMNHFPAVETSIIEHGVD